MIKKKKERNWIIEQTNSMHIYISFFLGGVVSECNNIILFRYYLNGVDAFRLKLHIMNRRHVLDHTII